jgi:WhiB family redox-sensing transcriptional regulator
MIQEDGPEFFSAEYRALMDAIEEVGQTPCMNAPDFFFPDEGKDWGQKMSDTNQAKKLCSMCPVRLQCLEYALVAREWDGVWGGLSGNERKKLIRAA